MNYEESHIQKGIVRAVRYSFPKAVIFSVPNEGKRNVNFASALKLSGMTHGVSDLICIHNKKIYFLEVKTEKGKQTEYQKEFEFKIKSQGFAYHIVRSTEETLQILNK